VLVWEGDIGAFYLADRTGHSLSRLEVLSQPGARYALLYALADPTYPPGGTFPRLEDAGKLMALAAYGREAPPGVLARGIVDAILAIEDCYSTPKVTFKHHPLYNAGVEHPLVASAAAHMTDRLFEIFASFALERLPPGLDLRISGGCGLNCEWNRRWQELGLFRSVFVPPCTDDSGSAIGTAIDALLHTTGEPWIEWSCYSGQQFIDDLAGVPEGWHPASLDLDLLARRLAGGAVVAWVQGRSEIGPRALGHRSLLAEPFSAATRDRLNRIKGRETFRPIAPCCTLGDVGRISPDTFEDPFMLYFRPMTDARLGAVTHVDGSARVQTVSQDTNARLHRLILEFGRQAGVAVLCNTSLNRKGCGFINRSSTLFDYCSRNGIHDAVVNDTWFSYQPVLETEDATAPVHRSPARLS
jgi:hydroxymethyl cephem carbamoyltransferase